MAQDDLPLSDEPLQGRPPEADAHLLDQLRGGDADAGRRFVRECYPELYRYLLYLTGHRETAEDLTQETFLQAWSHLDQFQGRGPLRVWLHTIARRQFLQATRRQRNVISLEEATELADPHADVRTEDAELRVLLSRLPEEQREVMALCALGGYSSGEIAEIIQMPARTVRHRLGAARAHLAQALGHGDLGYLNEPSVPMRQWAWLPLDQMYALETRLSVRNEERGTRNEHGTSDTRSSFLIPRSSAREAPGPEATKEESMERREFLRQAAVGAAGLMLSETEKEVIDSRLTQKVTCAFKGTALSDLCEKLKTDTGIHLAAGPSVADEKVTLFCEKLPLREVMRQLSRPFGYTWLRSGQAFRRSGVQAFEGDTADPNTQYPTPDTEYRYELAQDLRSQLLEEELRNRDRNAALLALDREMERYRPYLSLSPEEAQARVKTIPPGDQPLLERLAGPGWGPIQMYFRLSTQEQAALRAGQELRFSQDGQDPGPVDRSPVACGPLPPDIARGVLQSRRDLRILRQDSSEGDSSQPSPGGRSGWAWASETSRGLPPSAVAEARAAVSLRLDETELDQFSLSGEAAVYMAGWGNNQGSGHVAVGRSPAVLDPENARRNARLAGDPSLRQPVTLHPQPAHGAGLTDSSFDAAAAGAENREHRVTSADVLEALHRVTGLPIVADFYTRLYPLATVSVSGQPLFEALNRLTDGMRLRWHKEASTREAGGWLQFRSVSFYDDRLKEVPNRLLSHWAAARREHGYLTLDDLTAIAGLPDAALDALDMGEGARECWGLAEWDLACNRQLRPHLRWMANLTAAERQKVQRAPGLRFTELSLAHQQQFIALAAGWSPDAIGSLEELATAAVQLDYSRPGEFEWRPPSRHAGTPEPPELLIPLRARAREEALAAAHRIDPQADPAQIQPTQLALALLYRWGTPQANGSLWITARGRSQTGVNRTVSRTQYRDSP